MKALCVFSGGLDSMLAAELIRVQDVDVLALFFETPFFGAQRARESAEFMNLPLKVIDITEPHLAVVKHPRHGYGGNMNPCIDCHTLMFRLAGEMLPSEGAHFVISGEVLGQRPMSQNKRSLELIASESGLGNLLLRPLSARNLPPTIAEEKGWVNRDLLMDIQGRSRKPQMALASRFHITQYPSPAGGCPLTEQVFSRRLKDLLSAGEEDPERAHIELLKYGRHFRISPETKLVVGRNKRENEAIRALARETDYVLTSVGVPGPTAVLSGNISREMLDLAALIVTAYSDASEPAQNEVRVTAGNEERLMSARASDKGQYRRYMI